MDILLDNHIPYCWDAGNHDFNRTLYIGNQYAAFNPQILASKQYWLSSKYDGMNTAVFFNVSDWECLVLNISFKANDTVLEWANSLIEKYPNGHAIVATHAYLDKQCRYDDWATHLQAKVLDTHTNVFLSLSGHYYPTIGNQTKNNGRDELLFNQQDSYDKQSAASARILTFNPQNGTITVQTYNVYLDCFISDANNCFTIHTFFRSSPVGRGFTVWVVVMLLVVSVVLLFCGLNRRGVGGGFLFRL